MKLRNALVVGLLGVGTLATAAPVDRVRALLYRVDGEAKVARTHPELAREHAEAAARFARQAAGDVQGDPSLRPEAVALERATDELRVAAREGEDQAVVNAASDVAASVRRLDEALPPPPPAR